jgi:hypothetical protein
VIKQHNPGGNQVLPQGAVSEVSPRGSNHGLSEFDEITDLPQSLLNFHILHNGDFLESSDSLESIRPQEQPLIPVGKEG